jgi:flagellar FliJ protein
VNDKAFKFRLERVRWLRQQTEQRAQEELAASLGRRLECERSLHEVDASIESAREAERSAAGPEAGLRNGEEMLAMENYLVRLAGSRAAAARSLAERNGEVDDRRRGLLAAARERQALDRLRGRRLSEHRQEAARAEGAELDELALTAHRRGKAAA